jgi:hypothetical protein
MNEAILVFLGCLWKGPRSAVVGFGPFILGVDTSDKLKVLAVRCVSFSLEVCDWSKTVLSSKPIVLWRVLLE